MNTSLVVFDTKVIDLTAELDDPTDLLFSVSDERAPSFNAALAGQLAALGVPAFACTPDRFPDLMGAAIGGQRLTVAST